MERVCKALKWLFYGLTTLAVLSVTALIVLTTAAVLFILKIFIGLIVAVTLAATLLKELVVPSKTP